MAAIPSSRILILGDGTGGGASAVTASAVIADNILVRGDGGVRGIQGSGITVADTTNALSGLSSLTATAATDLTLTGGSSGASVTVGQLTGGANATITLTPIGTGLNISAGPMRINGTSTLRFGATANATIGVSADTTAGVLTLTAPSSGSILLSGTTATSGQININGATGTNINDTNIWHGTTNANIGVLGDATGRAYFKAYGSTHATLADLVDIGTVNALTLRISGGAAATLTGGAGNMTVTAGTGASRTLTLQTTTAGSTATDAIVIGAAQTITKYANVTAVGWGVPAIYGAGVVDGSVDARSAAVATYTVGAAAGAFEVGGNVNVTASVTHSFSLDVTYTDETNAARTLILPLAQLAGTFITGGLVTNVTGTGPYESPAMTIRCKGATTITVRPSAGTFTSVTYNASGYIKQIS